MRVVLAVSPTKLPSGLSEVFLRSIVRETCTRAFPSVFADKTRGVKLEVAFVSDAKMARLNRDYREKDKTTDVLSFGEFENPEAIKKTKEKTIEIGTLILSLPFIKRSAKEDGVSWKKEFVFVFSHGVLHLMGHDHSEEMFALQDEVTDELARS